MSGINRLVTLLYPPWLSLIGENTMALSPNIQLEAAFVTPEGQEVIALWKNYVRWRKGRGPPVIWGDGHRLWIKNFGYIASSHTAYGYWVEQYDVS